MGATELLQRDKRVKKLNKMLEGGSFALDTDMRIREMLNTHKTKKIRQLTTRQVLENFQHKVISATLENQKFRSRVVEIYTECFLLSNKLDKHISALRKHLSTHYSVALQKAASTVADRKSIIDTVLEPAIQRQQEIAEVQKIADLLREDIDSGGWSVKNIISTMEIISEKKAARI